MLSKGKIKLIKSLNLKKYRDKYGLFVAEGSKSVLELSEYFICESLIATTEWLEKNSISCEECINVNENDLKKISNFKTPQEVLAVFRKKKNELSIADINNQLSIYLDEIQDPGNLGSIIRIADWFGIKNIICSLNTVDAFNFKTVQASMGSIARVNISYKEAKNLFPLLKKDLAIMGAFLNGENIYTCSLPQKGIIVMGNEGNGISSEVSAFVTKKIHIPNFSIGENPTESLNVGVATAIICSEFKRRFS